MDEQRAEAAKTIERMRAAFKDVPEEELEEEVDKAVAQVRAETQAQPQATRTQR